MLITEPTLPPKAGFVEVEKDGVRVYEKVPTEQDERIAALEAANEALQANNETLQATIDTLVISALEG